MPDTTGGVNRFREGDSSTSFEDVRRALAPFPFAQVHRGFIPEALEDSPSIVSPGRYIDVNIYAAVRNSLEFIYPRLLPGGSLVLDDYGFPSCPGVRRAMNDSSPTGARRSPSVCPPGRVS